MSIIKINKNVQKIISHLLSYPTPINLNYLWSFGFLAGFFLTVQIISGILLAMFYEPGAQNAFASVEYILRDVSNGWLLRYLHINSASFFFIVLYFHIGKAIYYGSYIHSNKYIWLSGCVLYILVMATGFLGYVLPWGQMSFWGATVITNFASIVPILGDFIVVTVWGGYSVNPATLTRFFSLHYLLPFIIFALMLIHLAVLHSQGSSNPVSGDSVNNIPFLLYLFSKDLHAVFSFLTILSFMYCFFPNTLGHPDNYILANSQVTPPHIVPEWYFLPFYAILKSFSSKAVGVIVMFLAIVLVAVLPLFAVGLWIQCPEHKYFREEFSWLFFFSFITLGYLGQLNPSPLTVQFSFIFTLIYFYCVYYVVLDDDWSMRFMWRGRYVVLPLESVKTWWWKGGFLGRF
jgi:ubiquinol-cytochrome c reductase cytochrome b/c1 subunit